MILGIDTTYFAYINWVSAMQSMMDIYLMKIVCKTKDNKKYPWLIFFLLFHVHDLFFSMYSESYVSKVGLIGEVVEILIFATILFSLIRVFCKGNTLRSFTYILSLDFLVQIMTMLISMPWFLIEIQFNIEGMTSFVNTPSVKNMLIVLVLYAVSMWIMGNVWKSLYKRKNSFFEVMCIILSCLDVFSTIMSGFPMIGLFFPIYIVLISLILRSQNIYEKQLREQYDYYRKMEALQKEKDEEVAKIRHDIANHINVLEELNKDDEGKQILERIDKNRNKLSGNTILDCLILEKEKVCAEKDITFTKNVSAIQLRISDYEIVGILANLLDNAIEACEKTDADKSILFELSDQQGILHIYIENGKNPEEKPLENKMYTTKKNKHKHGYGSRIVRDIVNRNAGRITYEDKGTRMSVKIWL